MQVYLFRHADAIPREACAVDAYRWLSRAGRKQARRVGKLLDRLDVEWDLVLTSPAARAVQTAEVAAARLGFRGPIVVAEALLSGKGSWAAYRAAGETREGALSVALVGHEPDLGIAAGQALGRPPIALPKGAVLGLEIDAAGAVRLIGLLRPDGKDWEALPRIEPEAPPEKKAEPAEKGVAAQDLVGDTAVDKKVAKPRPPARRGAGRATARK